MSKKTEAPKQPAPITEGETSDLMGWVKARQRLVVGLAAAVVVVGLGTWVVIETGQRRQVRAAEALDQARNIAENGNLPLAASELQKIIETFDGTEAATEAVVTLNQVRMVNGQSELAIVGLQAYLKTDPKAVYKVPALGLLGEAFENAGRPAEAGAAYRSASADAEVDYLKAQYLLSAARAFTNAGDTAAAVDALQTILDKYAKSNAVTEATVRLSELTQGRMTVGS